MPGATTVFVCRECKHHRSLERALSKSDEIDIRFVGCQKVCEEPVCGVRTGGTITWLEGMDKPKRQDALVEYLEHGRGGGKLPAVLEKARSKRRSKKPR